MRNAILILLCLSVFLSCKKDSEVNEGSDSIIGTWELYQSASGMMPFTTYPSGNGFTMSFDSTHIRLRKNGQVSFEDQYHLTTDSIVDLNSCELKPAASNKPNRIIMHSNPPAYRMSFEIVGGKLKIMSGCFPLDGGWSLYRRKTGSTTE
jgi:hypothetical protein